MIDMSNLKLSDVMPANLLQDRVIKAMCDALDVQITKLVNNNARLSIYANIDNLPEKVIDYLAWQFHVDFYTDDMSLNKKRDIVKKSISWHRHKGTLGMVGDYVTTLFGGAKVYEWFDYNGQPYHFKIDLITSDIPDINELQKIVENLFIVKNTRSWCDEIGFLRTLQSIIYYAGIPALFKEIEVSPATITDSAITLKPRFTGLINIHKENEVVFNA